MFNKLIIRNVKRSFGDYLIYVSTMVIVVALMLAFHSMIFSKSIQKICSMGAFVGFMIGFATVFVLIIIAWLINYMVKFMMQRRSTEFASYMLIGMEKGEVAGLFLKENQFLGILSFVLGIIPGLIFQALLSFVFSQMMGSAWPYRFEFSPLNLILTFVLYFTIFEMALMRNVRKFNKVSIYDLMYMSRQNETIKNRGIKSAYAGFFISILYIVFFNYSLAKGIVNTGSIFLFLTGLIISCYLFYNGLSAFFIHHIDKKNKSIYKNTRLFLFRQFSSKIKTMRFTMGTLTVFFTAALVSFSISIMFNDYLKNQMDQKLPFDVIVFSDDTEDSFEEELDVIESESQINSSFIYRVYTDKSGQLRECILNSKDKRLNRGEVQKNGNQANYFEYDTFLRLSDYNRLREMLGLSQITLGDQGYLVHAKKRLCSCLAEVTKNGAFQLDGKKLDFEGFYTEGFAQNGQNGSDYIVVVPDAMVQNMDTYYSLLAVDLKGEGTVKMFDELNKLDDHKNPETGDMETSVVWGRGTDDFVTCTNIVQVKTPQTNEIKFVLIAISYPLIYIGIVFLCVGLTIISVQQLSDINKFKFRYSILRKLGLSEKEINSTVFKQLCGFYYLPILIALVVSAFFSIYISNYFGYYTGLSSKIYVHFAVSVFIVILIYNCYFLFTYSRFKKGIK